MIPDAAIRDLQMRVSGRVLVPDDEGYDAARSVFNMMIDRRPALIAQCRNADDVVSALGFARGQNLLVSVKCTEHNVAGFAAGLWRFNAVQYSCRDVGAGLNTNVSISSLRAPAASSTTIRTGNSPWRVTVPCHTAVPATGSTW